MPRRAKFVRREIPPDVVYQSTLVQQMINKVMQRGKKALAERIVYKAMAQAAERLKKDPVEVVEQALRNASPSVEVKPRRVGGATYQVPVEVRSDRRTSLAIRWMLRSARSRTGKPFYERLAAELIDAYHNTGATIKRKEDVHKMAESNRAFAHYGRL